MANRTFTINLEANATDLIKQFKAGSKELEKFAKGVAQAENKLEALQEAGAYLAQMDKALSQLSTKYPDVFNKVFGKVNAQIKKSLEPIAQSGAIIQKIGSQLEGISTGKLDATNTEMKQLGETVQTLAKAMNVDINLDFLDGSGKAKTKAKQLIDVMAELTKSYSGVSAASSKSKTKKKEMPYEELSKTVEAIKLLSKKAGDGDDSAFDAMDRKISKLVKSFALSEDGIAQLDVLLQNLDDSLDTTMSKLQVLLGEQFPTGQFDNLSTSAEDAKTNIDSLTSSIINAFNAADKLQRAGGAGNETMNLVGAKGVVSSAKGQDLTIDAGTMVNQLLANLKESIVMSLHDHPNASDAFTPDDIKSYAELYYGQGTKLHGIIANGLIKTIDFNGISQELAIKIAESYSKNISEALMKSKLFDFKDGDIIPTDAFNKLDVGSQDEAREALILELNDALDKAFVDNGLESTVREWYESEIPELSQYLQQLGASAQETISPLEKLKNLFETLNPGVQTDWNNFAAILDQFSSGAIDASTALEMMLNKTKELKQVGAEVPDNAGVDPAKVNEGTAAIEGQTEALRERNRVEQENKFQDIDKNIHGWGMMSKRQDIGVLYKKEYASLSEAVLNDPNFMDRLKEYRQQLVEDLNAFKESSSSDPEFDNSLIDFQNDWINEVDHITGFIEKFKEYGFGAVKSFEELQLLYSEYKKLDSSIDYGLLESVDDIPTDRSKADIKKEFKNLFKVRNNEIKALSSDTDFINEYGEGAKPNEKHIERTTTKLKALAAAYVQAGGALEDFTKKEQVVAKEGIDSYARSEDLNARADYIRNRIDRGYDVDSNAWYSGDLEKIAQQLGIEIPAAANKTEAAMEQVAAATNKAEAAAKELVTAVKLPDPADFKRTFLPSEDQIARVRQLAEEYKTIYSLLRRGGLDDSTSNALVERAKYIEDVMRKVKTTSGYMSEPDPTFNSLKRVYGISDIAALTLGQVDTASMKESDNASRQKAIDLIQQEIAAIKKLIHAKAETMAAEKQINSGQSFEKTEQGAKEATNAVNGLAQALEKEAKAEQKADGVTGEPKSDLPRETVDTSAEVGDLEQLRAKLDEVQAAIESKTAAFTTEGQTVDSVVATEVQSLEQLRKKIDDVKAAIDTKTAAFTTEGQIVDSVVAQEVASLERLQKKLGEISATIGGIGKIELGADGNVVPTVSPSPNADDNKVIKEIKIEGAEELKSSISSLRQTIENAIVIIKSGKGGQKEDFLTAKPKKKKFKDQTIHYGSASGGDSTEEEERRIRKIFDYYYWIEEQLEKFSNNKLYKQALENVQEHLKPDIDEFYEKLGDNVEPYWLANLNETHDLHLAQIKGGQAYSDSVNTEKRALDLLQEEWKLRQEIFSLQQKGATEEDLGPLREKINLYSDLRKVIEESMTPEEAARYGASATKIQGAGENKMTVAEVRAELKERLAAEREALKAQQAVQKKAESEAQKFNLVGQKNELSWIKESVDFKSTGIDRATTDTYARRVIEAYDELIGKISVFSSLDREITAEEMQGLRDSAAVVREKIEAYNFLADAKARAKEFITNKDEAKASLDGYFNSLNMDFVSEDSLSKLGELESRLNSIVNNDGLEAWKRDFTSVTESISRATNEAEQFQLALQNRQLQGIKNAATNSYKAADIDPDNMTEGQKKLSESYDELMAKIEVYAKRRGQISDEEMADLERIAAEIKKQAAGYELQAKNNAIEKSGQSKLATLIGSAKNAGIAESDMGAAAINKAREAWDAYATALKNMPKNPTLDDEIAVKQLAAAYDQATAELKELTREANNFAKKAAWNKIVDVDVDNRGSRKTALEDAVRELTEGNKVKMGRLSNDGYSLDYSIQNADKSWSHFTATLNKAGTVITATNKKVQTTDGLFKSLVTGSLDKMKNALQVFSGYDLFFRGIEEIRRGVQYITEIDTALTELKKVTDETDATYNQFLQTMSKTGAAIGATVANLTTMAADWARLNI